jgi:heme/copper-type cytochrome/quinol oxidase subunit 2
MGRLRHVIIIAILVALSTVGLRALFSVILALPRASSAEAGPIDALFSGHYWMIAFLFSLIMVMMLYSVFVFRRQDGGETDGPHFIATRSWRSAGRSCRRPSSGLWRVGAGAQRNYLPNPTK